MSKELDKDYEALVEDYEDALMRVVMYRVAREDGRRLLKEAEELERSGLEVPRELDEKCRRLIQAGCAPQEHSRAPAKAGARDNKPSRRFTLARAGQIFVVAILAAVLLFCVAYAANEQFRVDVLNFFLELRENGTWFSFGPGGSGDAQPNQPGGDEYFPFEFTYIPEGYELSMHDSQTDVVRFSETYDYPNHDFKRFSFDVFTITSSTGLLVDTEDAEVKNVKIHDCDGQIIKKIDALSGEPEIIYIWFDLKNHLGFRYFSMGILPEESQKIFDGIVISEQF